MNAKGQLIFPLDTGDLSEARRWVKLLRPYISIFKVGKELFTSAGPESVKTVRDSGGEVFLDLKYHDIPHTVAQATSAATHLGVLMLNLHAFGGREMLQAGARAAEQTSARMRIRRPRVLAVTVLTSLGSDDLHQLGIRRSVAHLVEGLGRMAKDCGLDGVVCSPEEIPIIRKACGRNFLIISPGVRPKGFGRDDHKRVLTPQEAIGAGADYLIIGRPIREAPDPGAAAAKILEEINK